MSSKYARMQKFLMEELRLYHYPIATTFIFADEELASFNKIPHFVPNRPITFCQCELVARMQGKTILLTPKLLGCGAALLAFGMKKIDKFDFKIQMRFCKDADQAERFLHSKPHMPLGSLKAIVVSPLADTPLPPTVIHFYCDNLQSYQLTVDWMAAVNRHPLRPMVCMSSAACGGSVFCYLEKSANITPACAGSYNSGKMERGEIHTFIPGPDIEAVIHRMQERKKRNKGGSSITRLGDPFPGVNICKNCTFISFKPKGNA